MTEEEALTKWCPFVRFTPSTSDWKGFNSRAVALTDERTTGDVATCIGAGCMAWRGRPTDNFNSRAEAAFRRDGARLTPSPTDIDGFCGLAGATS